MSRRRLEELARAGEAVSGGPNSEHGHYPNLPGFLVSGSSSSSSESSNHTLNIQPLDDVIDVEPARPAETMEQFLQQIHRIHTLTEDITAMAEEIKRLNQRSLAEVNPSASSDLRARIAKITADSNARIQETRSLVSILAKSKRGDKQARMSHRQNALTKLRTAVAAFYSAQEQVRKTTREQLARQYKIIQPDATDEEVLRAIEGREETGGDFFWKEMVGVKVQEKQNILSSVQERQTALASLSKSLQQLVEMMAELQCMLENHQEMIDEVEEKAGNAQALIESTLPIIDDALGKSSRLRKRQQAMALIAVLVLLIIAAVLAIYLATRK